MHFAEQTGEEISLKMYLKYCVVTRLDPSDCDQGMTFAALSKAVTENQQSIQSQKTL